MEKGFYEVENNECSICGFDFEFHTSKGLEVCKEEYEKEK